MDTFAQRFPPKYKPQAQLKFGKMPLAEAANMASNMVVSNHPDPQEERKSALLRIQSVSRGQKPGKLYQNPVVSNFHAKQDQGQSSEAQQYVGVSERPAQLL